MNRYVLIAGAVITALLVVLGLFLLFSRPEVQAPPQNQQQVITPNTSYTVPLTQTQTELREKVRAAFQTQVAEGHPDNIVLKNTVVAGDWALQSWTGDIMGGEAILKYDAGKDEWRVQDIGGGSWSVEGLVIFGVPQEVAEALLEGRPY